MHAEQPEIIVLKTPSSAKCKLKLAESRNKGAKIHNDTLGENERVFNDDGFQVKYRPKCAKNTSRDYVLCAGCSGYHNEKFLWRHQKRCKLCSPTNRGSGKGRELETLPKAATTPTKKMLQKLRTDFISDIIIYDRLLVRYAERLSVKGEHQYVYARNTLRELGRLLHQMRLLRIIPKWIWFPF